MRRWNFFESGACLDFGDFDGLGDGRRTTENRVCGVRGALGGDGVGVSGHRSGRAWGMLWATSGSIFGSRKWVGGAHWGGKVGRRVAEEGEIDQNVKK